MGATDLVTIDRQTMLAARALASWRAELVLDDSRDDDDPLAAFGELVSKTMLKAIAGATLAPLSTTPALLLSSGEQSGATLVGSIDPFAELRPALEHWCAHFLLAQGLRELTVARVQSTRDERDCESYGKPATLRGMMRSLARPKQAGGVPEPRAAAAIESLAPGLLEPLVEEELRRRELAEELGPVAACCLRIDDDAVAIADRFLADTADEAEDLLKFGLRCCGRETRTPTWVDALAVRRAADSAEGWPGTLTPRWFAELARGTALFEGLKIDARVDAGRLGPRADESALRLTPPTGAWTFARALHAVGVELRLVGRDPRVPFSVHHQPHDVRALAFGEAFAQLVTTPAFHSRARGLAHSKAELAARRLGTTRLLERRHLALRVALAPDLHRGRRRFVEAFADRAGAAIGGETPRELASLLGGPGVLGPAEDAARVRSFAAGDALAQELREKFDVDWWRNPKAASWIRERCAR